MFLEGRIKQIKQRLQTFNYKEKTGELISESKTSTEDLPLRANICYF